MKAGAEGARRKPNLSGKRTERVPDVCGRSSAVCSLELLVKTTGSFLLCKNSMQREKQHGYLTQNRADHQHVPVRLCADHPAARRGSVFHHPHAVRAGALLRRGLAALLRRVQSQRREAQIRHELVPGAGDGCRGAGRHRQHRRRLRCDPHRRPRCDLLDVVHRILRHGDDLCRGGARAGDACGRAGRHGPRRPGVLHQARIPERLRQVPGRFLRGRDHSGARLHGLHGAVQLHW